MSEAEDVSRRAQFGALLRVASNKPVFTGAIIAVGVFAAPLEGIAYTELDADSGTESKMTVDY